MRATLVIAVLLAASLAAANHAPNYKAMFQNFKTKFAKSYATPAEEAHRFEVFVHNMKLAEGLQAVNPKATFGAGVYADRTQAEFKPYHGGEKYFKAKKATTTKLTKVISYTKEEEAAAKGQAIDWRTKGAVTGVKNQGQCGSCWSFSTTGGIEGQWFLAGNTLTSLSEQELVSCDTIDSGCNGGLMSNAYEWLLENRGGALETEASYPYVSGDGSVPACADSGKPTGATITGSASITKTESAMATWVLANGPLSIAVDATSWQTYTGGIMTDCISSAIDHGVLIVGFDDTNDPPYWIIKNSWGASWGEAGYIRVQKGTDQCLITDDPCSATVAKAGPTQPSPNTPNPPPPPPPNPNPPPVPPPSGDTFTQTSCSDSACSEDCSSNTFPLGVCLNLTSGGSATAACSSGSGTSSGSAGALTLTVYAFSEDCSGYSFPDSEPTDQCLATLSGGYVENTCNNGDMVPGRHAQTHVNVKATGKIAARVRMLQKKHNHLLKKMH